MNDDDNKPLVPEGGVDESKPTTEADETKIEVKTNSSSSENEPKDQSDEIDITAALNGEDVTPEEEPEEPVSDFDRELDRVEGIESAATATAAPEASVEEELSKLDKTEDVDMTAPVDLDEKTEIEEKKAEIAAVASKPKEEVANAAFVSALQQQDQKKKEKKGAAGIIAVLLAILVVAAGAGAAFFYLQWSDARDQLSAVESDLDSERTKIAGLQAEVAELDDESQAAEPEAATYVVIKELGVRYKVTAENENLIYAYLGTTVAENVKTIGFSTVKLSDVREGASAPVQNPCGVNDGSMGMISRYDTGTPAAGTVTRKVGEFTYVFTSPQNACTTSVPAAELEAVTAQVKAVFETLELIPVDDAADQAVSGDDTATSSDMQTPATSTTN